MTQAETTLYLLISWFSPGFPTGGFSYSHGIEYAVTDGLVHDRDSLADWVDAIITHGVGCSDAALFCTVYRAAEAVDTAALSWTAERADAMRGTSEFALENSGQGTAFLATVEAAWPDTAFEHLKDVLSRINHQASFPVVAAVACTVGKIPLQSALTAYLHAFAANLVSAGVRLIPLGQTDGQRVIAALESCVVSAVGHGLERAIEDIGSAAPMVDLTSMQHETQYTRLFRS